MTETLFDLDQEPPEVEPIEWHDDDAASASCRYCQTRTTARGIVSRGHGPDSATCARMLAWAE